MSGDDLQWWGYLHRNGSIRLKRIEGDPSIDDPEFSASFVLKRVLPFVAPSRDAALRILTDRLSRASTMAEMWAAYRLTGIPRNAPNLQVSEMRKGFYVGATALMSIMKAIDNDVSEEDGAEILERLDAELQAFFRGLGH